MSTLRATFILLRHALGLWRAGQVRFRLETFGVYFPTAPYSAPWWRMSPSVLILLLRRARAYAEWVEELDRIRRGGSETWWDGKRPQGTDWSQRLP
jgi:hypothetical protein